MRNAHEPPGYLPPAPVPRRPTVLLRGLLVLIYLLVCQQSLIADSAIDDRAVDDRASEDRASKDSAANLPSLSFSDEASVAWVLVPVTVRNQRGDLVEDLEISDFRLLLDEREILIESFDHGGDQAVSLIHLQDLSGSMANGTKLAVSRQTLRFFLDRATAGDEFALATFAAGRTRVAVPFTDQVSLLRQQMDQWNGWGTTALHDAVAWLPDIKTAGRNPKRGALLLTDGADNASQLAPAFARRVVRQAELPIYVLDLSGGPRPGESRANRELLRRLAATSGGRYFSINTSTIDPDATTTEASTAAGWLAACQAIAEELRYQYVLGFQTRADGGTAYHPLQVQVKRSRLAVQHRQGYRGSLPGTLRPARLGRRTSSHQSPPRTPLLMSALGDIFPVRNPTP